MAASYQSHVSLKLKQLEEAYLGMLGKDVNHETAKSWPSAVQNLLSHVSPDEESWGKVYGESGQESEAGPGQKFWNV